MVNKVVDSCKFLNGAIHNYSLLSKGFTASQRAEITLSSILFIYRCTHIHTYLVLGYIFIKIASAD